LKRIIFVPGKNKKPPPNEHRALLERCLVEGVRLHDARVADEIIASEAFSLVAWNHLLYKGTRSLSLDKPWVDKLINRGSLLPGDEVRTHSRKYLAARLMYQVGDLFPWLIPLIPDQRIKNSAQETRRYFRNHDNIACRIRQLQKEPLRAAVKNSDKVLLIAHSMGSIVAYDALWELDHLEGIKNCVDCFLTMGSPLGMRYVQSRLLGSGKSDSQRFPSNIRYWVNVAAHGDLIALDSTLNNDFSVMLKNNMIEEMRDMYEDIFNNYQDDKGINSHKSYGYLLNPKVSSEICAWWKNA